MKSDAVKKGIDRAPHRSLFKAMGYTDTEIKRPLIGIANLANAIIPGHIHLDKITEAVKAGVYMAGGTPIEDLYHAGGIGAVVREFGRKGLIHEDCLTVTGKTVGEISQKARTIDPDVIRPVENPYHEQGGPIAAVQEGDHIRIDIPDKTITLMVSKEDIRQRLASWSQPQPRITRG